MERINDNLEALKAFRSAVRAADNASGGNRINGIWDKVFETHFSLFGFGFSDATGECCFYRK